MLTAMQEKKKAYCKVEDKLVTVVFINKEILVVDVLDVHEPSCHF